MKATSMKATPMKAMPMKKNLIYLIALPLIAVLIHTVATRAMNSAPVSDINAQTQAQPLQIPTSLHSASNVPPLHDAVNEVQNVLLGTSLANTHPPPVPPPDADGNVLPQRALRDVFDYFLSLEGERDAADIHIMIDAYLAVHLPAHAVAQVMQILEQYQTLNQRLMEITDSLEGDSLQEKLQKLAALRRELLGDNVAEAFFADEEAYDRYSLALLERQHHDIAGVNDNKAHDQIDNDRHADPLVSQADLLTSLPEDLQVRQRERLRQQYLVEETQRLEKQGATAAELYQFHLLHGDAAVAERYQALATQREAWQQRVTSYRQQRNDIARLTLRESEKAARVQQLLSASFSKSEILRMNALESMETR